MKTKTPSAKADTIPSLEAILAMKAQERIALYQHCDSAMRSRFLTQGKIIFSFDDGEESLRKAGVSPSSLGNARLAAAALELSSERLAKVRGSAVLIRVAGQKKPVPFDEAVYDTLTLEQCRLLAFGSTNRGDRSVAHKPTPDAFYALLEKYEEWDQELACYFEHGATRAMLAAQEKESAKRLADEKKRVKAAQDMQSGATPPAGPVVGAPPVSEDTETGSAGDAETPGKVVQFSDAGGTHGAPSHDDEEVDHSSSVLTPKEWNEECDIFESMTTACAAAHGDKDRQHMIGRLRELAGKLEHVGHKVGKAKKTKGKQGKKPAKKAA